MKRKLTIALTLALLTTSCKPLPFYWITPEGPPEYVQGFEDGCDSGVAAAGGIWYKWIYKFKKDPTKLNNGLYKQGWNEGFSYCRFNLNSTQKFFN